MEVNGIEYKSRWDYMAAKTGGPTKATLGQPEDPFQIVGWFEGDWKTELKMLFKKYNINKGFNFLTKLGQDYNMRTIKPYTYEMDKYDMEEVMGITTDSEFVSKLTYNHLMESSDICPNIWKMINWFGFKPGTIIPKIHIQLPGQVFPFHYDEFTTIRKNIETTDHDLDVNPDKFARIEVQLFDWDFGHVWGLGNTYWKDWKAGEIMWHNWYDMPHGTANCGITPRVCLQVTGEVDDILFQKLRQNNGVLKLDEL